MYVCNVYGMVEANSEAILCSDDITKILLHFQEQRHCQLYGFLNVFRITITTVFTIVIKLISEVLCIHSKRIWTVLPYVIVYKLGESPDIISFLT